MASRKLEVEIVGDSRSLERAFGRSSKASSGFSKALKGVGFAAVGVAGVAIAGLAVTLKRGFDELEEGQKVSAQTAAALKSTGNAAKVTQKHIEDLASAMSRTIPIDDEVIQAGENVLLSFENIRNEVGKGNDIFDRATKVAADYSARTGKDMSVAALTFGKALEDPLHKSSALARAGIILTDAQKEQIKAFQESGHTLEAQKVLLAALEERYKGAGAAAGQTLAGQLEIAKNQFDEIASKVAVKFLPILTGALNWINAHWTEISAVFQAVGTAISATINFLGPLIGKLIGYFKQLAEFSKKHWGEVQEAADRVVKWYRGTLAPAIQNVLTAIQAFWDKFGKAITRIVTVYFGVVLTVVKTILGNIASVMNIIMAVLRGDWGKAWAELKEIPARTLKGIVGVLRGFAIIFYTAMKAVGAAIVQGLLDGFKALWDSAWNYITGKFNALMGVLHKIPGVSSPSKVTVYIGRMLAEGLGVGFGQGMVSVEQGAADKITKAIDHMIQVVQDRRGALADAFSELASNALSAFDAITDKFQTKTEKKIAAQDAARANRERQRALQDAKDREAAARAAMATLRPEDVTRNEGESDEDFQARQLEAQKNFNDEMTRLQSDQTQALADIKEAQFQIQRAKDEQIAEHERQQYENRRGLYRRHLGEQLQATAGNLEKTLAVIKKFHIPIGKAANSLGLAIAEGLNDSIADVRKAARKLAEALADELRKLKVVVSVQVYSEAPPNVKGTAGPPKMQAGGITTREMFAHLHPNEAVIPLGSARAQGMMGGGGGVTVNFNGPVYGNERSIALAVRRELEKMGTWNGGGMLPKATG